MSNNGFFVISLDFELYWGMFDKVTLENYGHNIAGVHAAIPEMLSLFQKNDIHATWAAVGMLMFENKQALLQSITEVELKPHYKDMRVSSYEHVRNHPIGEDVNHDPYHFGSHLIEKIIVTPHQELGSHTFSHFYCIDGSENSKAVFAADCTAFQNVTKRFGQKITSIVFPRNQTTKDALDVCTLYGFTAYRGTPSHFLYTGKKEEKQTQLILRALRLIDTYINISGHHTSSVKDMNEGSLVNVRGSRFFRPYSHSLRILEHLRIARIKKGMTHAAKHHEAFHLWWHPHNFGINRKENMHALVEIIEHFKMLQEKYGMQSATMREMTTLASG